MSITGGNTKIKYVEDGGCAKTSESKVTTFAWLQKKHAV